MQVFEKIIDGLERRIETQHELIQKTEDEMQKYGLQKAFEAYEETKIFIETIREDYNNGWIKFDEEHLPERYAHCYVEMKRKEYDIHFVRELIWNPYERCWEHNNGKKLAECYIPLYWQKVTYPKPCQKGE